MRILPLVLVTIALLCTGVKADDYVRFDRVQFLGENHGGPGTWTQLRFKVIGPSSKTARLMYARNSAEFTLDASYKWFRTDLRYRNDWLVISKFDSGTGKKNDIYVGSRPPTVQQRRDLSKLSSTERLMAAWIIANTDELIEFALKSKKTIPLTARKRWEWLAKNDKFERNIRKNLGPFYTKEIAAYDAYAKHKRNALERMIQPNLQKLGYYKGKIDGLWGSQTKLAIMQFERDNNLFPDGVNYGKERQLLRSLTADVAKYSDVPATKRRIETLEKKLLRNSKLLDEQRNKLAEQRKKMEEAEEKSRNRYREIRRLDTVIADLKKRAKASKQEDLAKNRFEQVVELNKQISELRQELNKSKANSNKKLAKLYSEIAAWKSRAGKKNNLALDRYSQIVSLNKEIKALKADLAEMGESSLSEDQSFKLLAEIEAWRAKAFKQEDLAKDRFEQVVELNKKISELRQELSESAANINDSETLNEKVEQLTNELNLASIQQKDAEAYHQRLQADLIKQNKVELKSLAANLKKEIATLKSELAEAKGGTTSLPKFELDEDWIEFERFLAVQQVRFCQILLNYQEEAVSAADSRNQLRQNMVATNRDNDIAALLPSGNYKDWVAKVVEIYATPTGDAAFVLRLPCDVTFGSGQLPEIGDTDGEYAATAEVGGIIYNQLAQLAEGDTVLISGKILTYSDIGNTNQRLNFVTTLVNNQKFKSSPTKDRLAPDYFSSVNYLSKL